MAQSSVALPAEPVSSISNDNSMSTKEFLNFEKTCEAYKDCDEEIKSIFSEITKLAANHNKDKAIDSDVEDVDVILKRAQALSNETDNILKSPSYSAFRSVSNANLAETEILLTVPQIEVTKPADNKENEEKPGRHKAIRTLKRKETNEGRRKIKPRPFSAGVIDSKKREASKVPKCAESADKMTCKHESLVEELKDTNERVKGLELLNVQLTDDNNILKKKLDQISEEKHVAELKLVECEKFLSRIGKQYEVKHAEFKVVKENESKLLAELTKERNERKNLTIRHEKDTNVILDLQRQVKEMEMILRRKHPDSVSALIVAAKSSSLEDNKKKLLEDRIARLERELKDKEDHFQGILVTLQEKFGDMKQKYENHIIDVERQLMEDRKLNNDLKNKINKSNITESAVQTVGPLHRNVATQTGIKPDRASSAVSVSRVSQNSALLLNKLKEDSYLVATIKGLQAELTAKQRTIAKINRDTEELRKNLRSVQREKEVLLSLNPHTKYTRNNKLAKSTENILQKLNTKKEAELEEARKQMETFMVERNSLLDSLKRTNEEFLLLKKKRIQDLHTLQVTHEKELMQMNMQIYPLQEEIKLLNRTVDILQEKIRAADDKLLKYQAGIRDEMHAGGDTPCPSKNSFQRDRR